MAHDGRAPAREQEPAIDEAKVADGAQPSGRTTEVAVFLAAAVLVPLLDDSDLEALGLARLDDGAEG